MTTYPVYFSAHLPTEDDRLVLAHFTLRADGTCIDNATGNVVSSTITADQILGPPGNYSLSLHTEPGDFERNTFTMLAEPAMALAVPQPCSFVRDLFPTVSINGGGIDYNKPAAPKPPPPPPPLTPTPLRDFLTARAAEHAGTPLEAALAAVLELHQPNAAEDDDLSAWRPNACAGCGTSGYMDDSAAAHTDACATLRAVAAPFAEHPDFPDLKSRWEYDEWDFR